MPMMEMVSLPGTDLTVSRIGLGTVGFGSSVGEVLAWDQLDTYHALGGNLIDTAHVYGDWVPGEKSPSEKIIGRYLSHHRREDYVLCTKGGHFDLANRSLSRVTPKDLKEDLDQSLDFLQTGYVDIYMLHRDNPELEVGRIMDSLSAFVEDGRVRYLACSNWTAERHAEANAYAEKHGLPGFAVNELMWSMASANPGSLPSDQVMMDDEMLAFGRRAGISFFCYTALARGYLTKRYLGLETRGAKDYQNAANEALVVELKKLPSAADVTRASLRFFVREDVPCVPLVSFSDMRQLEECCEAFIRKDG